MTFFDPVTKIVFELGLKAFNSSHNPQIDGQITIKGIDHKVEIIRDRWGMPHIFGESLKNVVFGQGYAHAQERLWQMDLFRRIVAGRVSEILGKPGLSTDIAMRTWGFRGWAEKTVENISSEEREIVESFCKGVNACIEQQPLPIEFALLKYKPEPWTIADSFSWNYIMFQQLGSSWESEILRHQLITALGPEKAAELELNSEEIWPVILDANKQISFTEEHPISGPSRKDGVGSNNWVISAGRSASGSPLLANDMHLSLSSPSVFFQNHLCSPELEVVGVTFPGVPLVIQGHNGHVAWGMTNGFCDCQDLYEEHIRQQNGCDEYELKGEWYPVNCREETIKIKGESPHIEKVMETCHGPIINNALLSKISTELPPYAMRWTVFSANSFLAVFLKINRARNCSEFRNALREWKAVNQNVVFADAHDIGYVQVGEIPIRAKGDGSVPMPGWTGDHEWISQIPFEGLPQLENPARGYIVTANNRVSGPDFPYYLGRDYIYRDRAQRITEMIEERSAMDISAIQKMHFDQISPSARILVETAKSLKSEEKSIKQILEEFSNWDGKISAASQMAAIYEVWIRKILELMLAGKLSGLEERVRGNPSCGLWGFHSWEWLTSQLTKPQSPWWNLEQFQGRDAVVLEALRQSIEYLQKELGPDPHSWQWGKLHKLTFAHLMGQKKPLNLLFNLGPYPVGGDGCTIWATFSSNLDIKRQELVGPPFRFIIDMADPAHAQVIFAPGQSGRVGTRHYADGTGEWFSGNYHPLLFLREEIESNAEARLELIPQ